MNPDTRHAEQPAPPQDPAALEQIHQRSRLRELIAVSLAALALGGALKGADAVPHAYAKGAQKTAVVPNVKGDTLSQARYEASHAGLKVVGKVNIGKDKHLDPGEKSVASGLEARTSITKRVGGKLTRRSIFKFVRPGRVLKRGTQVKTEYRIVDDPTPVPGQDQPPSLTPGPVEQNPGTTPGPETPPPKEFDLNYETDKFLKENAVIIPALEACSGMILKDGQGKPVAVASAGHCIDQSLLQTDINGNQTLTTNQPLVVKQGDSESALTDVGTIDRILVASGQSASGEDNDLVLMPMNGASDQDAINAYKANLITDQTFQNLPAGTEVKSRGYPLDMPNNESSPRIARNLSGRIIAKVNINTNLYGKLPTIMAGYNPNPSDAAAGATCAPGYSGAVGIITQKGTNPDGTSKLVTFYVGIDSGVDDFRPPPLNIYTKRDPVYASKDIFTERKNQFGFTNQLDPYKNGAVCYWSNKAPNGFKTIKLKSTATGSVQSLSAAPPPSESAIKTEIDNSRVLGGTKAN